MPHNPQVWASQRGRLLQSLPQNHSTIGLTTAEEPQKLLQDFKALSPNSAAESLEMLGLLTESEALGFQKPSWFMVLHF